MREMILRHYSKEQFSLADPMKCGEREQRAGSKPCGLWLSDDADEECSWPAWCKAEDFRTDWLRFQYRATLRPDANVLMLCSASEIDAFTEEFAVEIADLGRHRVHHVDWPIIATRWQGIIITPYQWSRSLDGPARWYYGWDCASGCVWDISAFERFELEADLGLALETSQSTEA